MNPAHAPWQSRSSSSLCAFPHAGVSHQQVSTEYVFVRVTHCTLLYSAPRSEVGGDASARLWAARPLAHDDMGGEASRHERGGPYLCDPVGLDLPIDGTYSQSGNLLYVLFIVVCSQLDRIRSDGGGAQAARGHLQNATFDPVRKFHLLRPPDFARMRT